MLGRGAICRRRGGSGWPAGRRAIRSKTGRDLYDAAPDAGFVRLFYLPQSRQAVNFELLTGPQQLPRGLGQGVAEQALLDWHTARKARDAVGEAEARAQFAEMDREFRSYLPAGATLPPGRVDPGKLRQAITGDWESPFLSLSVRGDGTLSATMAGGAPQAAHWSVTSTGQVHTDVMGAALDIGASVTGGELTLGINGQALKLQRRLA